MAMSILRPPGADRSVARRPYRLAPCPPDFSLRGPGSRAPRVEPDVLLSRHRGRRNQEWLLDWPPEGAKGLDIGCCNGAPPRLLLRAPMIGRGLPALYKEKIGVERRLDPTHFVEYTRAGLEEELAAAGFAFVRGPEVRLGELAEIAPLAGTSGESA